MTGTSTISNANLNNISVSEERVYNNPTNLPTGTSGYAICKTVIVDSNSGYQEITFISAQSEAQYSRYIRAKTSGIWRDWCLVDTDSHYRLDAASTSTTSKVTAIPNLLTGIYMISTMNSVSATTRYGSSLYTFQYRGDTSQIFFAPIVEVANSKITAFTVAADGTVNITYDTAGYHYTYCRRI